MVRMGAIKWEKSLLCMPIDNLLSSDFPKYHPQPWKFMTGPARVEWLLSYEYQRLWIAERDQWNKIMYPENTTTNVDVVKHYVLTFNAKHKPHKPEEKKPFKMKRFEGIENKTSTKRSSDDKAVAFLKEKNALRNEKKSSKKGKKAIQK